MCFQRSCPSLMTLNEEYIHDLKHVHLASCQEGGHVQQKTQLVAAGEFQWW